MTVSEDTARAFLGPALHNGWPDFIPLPFSLLAVEVKFDGQVLTDEQRTIADILVAAGWRYVVLTVRRDNTIYLWDYGAQRELGEAEFRALYNRPRGQEVKT